MKALLYTDWCSIRSALKQYLAVCAFACIFLCAGSLADEPDAAAAAAEIQQTLVVYTGIMMTMMCFFRLFGSDERVGWEAVRLALPVSRREVVRSRYVFLALLLAALVLVGALVGTLAAALVTAAVYGSLVLPPASDLLLSMAACALGVALYSAVETPFFFWLGATKGRIAFCVPLMLAPLLTLPGAREWVASLSLDPVTAIVLGLPLAVVALVVSVATSQHLYEARDF